MAVIRRFCKFVLHHIRRAFWAKRLGYHAWYQRYYYLTDKDRRAILQHILQFRVQPTISIVMYVSDGNQEVLPDVLKSVKEQLYSRWNLTVVYDKAESKTLNMFLEECQKSDKRISLQSQEGTEKYETIREKLLLSLDGEFVTFMDQELLLESHALYLIANQINERPDASIIYCDCDHIDKEGVLSAPFFKPNWNYDYFLGTNYIEDIVIYRISLIHEIFNIRSDENIIHNFELTLNIIEMVPEKTIYHIPYVLCHRIKKDSISDRLDKKVAEEERDTIKRHFHRIGNHVAEVCTSLHDREIHHIVWPVTDPKPLVSIIIPTRDNIEVLSQCIDSLIHKTDYRHIEIIVVNNDSKRRTTFEYFDKLNRERNIRILEYSREFNYSGICNFAVGHAKRRVICLLNNDVEAIEEHLLYEMVGQALREKVAVVGAKLYYRNNTMQHAGTILGIRGVAGHSHRYAPRASQGYHSRLLTTQDVSSVTAACMVFRREVFEELGGFNEAELPVAFSDVNFCLRAREAGYSVIWTPHAELYHIEKYTRGKFITKSNRSRFKAESEYMPRM